LYSIMMGAMPCINAYVYDVAGFKSGGPDSPNLVLYSDFASTTHRPPPHSPTMSDQPAISTETYREKALRKFKQQPLVPVGATSLHAFYGFAY
jgi:hypothetical protein